MTLVPKREYITLLLGDIAVFVASLWLTLILRNFSIPSLGLLQTHLVPFSILFGMWIVVFFIAGLYGKHTRLFRTRLFSTILYTQTINMIIAALFFFIIPMFGLAPKTILILYLIVSFPLIFFWRVTLFPRLRTTRKLKGVLLASGPDAKALADEIQNDGRYPFTFDYIIDTGHAPTHEIIQQACRVAEVDDVTFLVVDFSDKAVSAALPIIYDAAFHKRRFALLDAIELYQELFDREPLSLMNYEWVLANISASRSYDFLKRMIDVAGAVILGLLSLILYPFAIVAIKLDDGGDIFITQHRTGRYQQPIRIIKFRSMSGNDEGMYDDSGKSKLKVTRVGRWLRVLRIDEIPQLWNVFVGDLSLVGPRPELPSLVQQYNARIPYYSARYLISPGLMGWAQLKHDRHPHHGTDIIATKEKLSYDLYYLKHRSLLLDVFIILQTIRILLTARGT
ncbi:MAG: sugar transferase [Candidatus Kaiserbacteria bacterium GW2011_GWC2_52_8b]|uniref:Sugar transferase n=2 Tax=Candidatus Kaiseribacteriota TaxID=1752734 RepID=A0A0G2ACQ4_9BACT|nr:MAG: sugar transferase [Candidatus Kaiserbacteria bacterium GW2011_GWA2_52_12]KKW30209.1 MAG: sugar transferase [Candidatus Kaiserbacteria bacterium GW2011_GWC2_52_8b]